MSRSRDVMTGSVLVVGILFFVVVLAMRGSHGTPPAQGAGAAAPERIEIPAIGVSAPIKPLGLNPDGSLEVPRDYGDTGWYTGGPEPGERGPAVVVGHVDDKDGPAVFYKLPRLKPGDDIRIERGDGTVVHFTVDKLEQWPKNGFPSDAVYGETDGPALRLVTCSGAFDRRTGHYTANTIVFASENS